LKQPNTFLVIAAPAPSMEFSHRSSVLNPLLTTKPAENDVNPATPILFLSTLNIAKELFLFKARPRTSMPALPISLRNISSVVNVLFVAKASANAKEPPLPIWMLVKMSDFKDVLVVNYLAIFFSVANVLPVQTPYKTSSSASFGMQRRRRTGDAAGLLRLALSV
jgi:hypothetical protein